jgi:hypothetical protein
VDSDRCSPIAALVWRLPDSVGTSECGDLDGAAGPGLLIRAVGDGDVDWEEVATAIDLPSRQFAVAIGPPQTAISCSWRWVLVGSSWVVPRPVVLGSARSESDSGDESPPPRRPRPCRRGSRPLILGRQVPALPVPPVTRLATRAQQWSEYRSSISARIMAGNVAPSWKVVVEQLAGLSLVWRRPNAGEKRCCRGQPGNEGSPLRPGEAPADDPSAHGSRPAG